MTNFSPKSTFSMFLFTMSVMLVMFLMSEVFNVESYREDHRSYMEDEAVTNDSSDSINGKNDIPGSTLALVDEKTISTDSIINEAIDADSITIDEKINTVGSEVEHKTTQTSTLSSEEYFSALLDDYKNSVLSQIPATTNRKDILVRYYRRVKDENKVNILTKYRYYIHERPIEDSISFQSNTISYGDNISSKDLQIIAYLLLDQGLPIKQIIPSRYHDGWKSNAVEISHDPEVRSEPALTLSEIRRFDNIYFTEE
jgi:hypothetical protein